MDITNVDFSYDIFNTLKFFVEDTPLQKCDYLSKQLNCNVYLKREDKSVIGSFKNRGVLYNVLSNPHKEYWCVSAGNHAQGVAFFSDIFNYYATIIMPVTVNKGKLDMLQNKYTHVNIILHGNNFEEALAFGLSHFSKDNYIPAYDSMITIYGQSTIVDELIQQQGKNIDYIFTPVGGGGLMSGLIKGVERHNCSAKVIGIEHTLNNCMTNSIFNNTPTEIDIIDNLCDGTAVNKPGSIPFSICKDSIILNVSKRKIMGELKKFYDKTGEFIEPSSALSIAGLRCFTKYKDISNKNIVLLITGKHICSSVKSKIISSE